MFTSIKCNSGVCKSIEILSFSQWIQRSSLFIVLIQDNQSQIAVFPVPLLWLSIIVIFANSILISFWNNGLSNIDNFDIQCNLLKTLPWWCLMNSSWSFFQLISSDAVNPLPSFVSINLACFLHNQIPFEGLLNCSTVSPHWPLGPFLAAL